MSLKTPFWQEEQNILKILSSLSYRTGELEGYLQDIAQGVSALIQLDWSTVTLCRDGFERVLASTIDLGEAGKQVYSLHGTLTATVVQLGTPLVVEDTLSNIEFGRGPDGYRAYLGVPLRTPTGEVIGTICSFQRCPRHFNTEEVRLVEIFAERAATAIDNYQLYKLQLQFNNELQQMNEQLHAEIRERQQAEAALRQSEEQLRQIAENMHQVLWMYSQDRQPIYISPAFEKIWQRSCQDWYTDPTICWDAIHPDERGRVQLAFDQAFDQSIPGEYCEEYRITRPDGSIRIIRDQSFHIQNAAGQLYRLAGIAEDITEQKQAQQEMVKAIASLAEVGELAAMIVHELRNPLTTVLMGLNAFKRMDLPDPARERLNLSLDEAERLRNLLNEILLYAKPQSLQRVEIEVNEFIAELLESVRTMPSAIKRRIEFIPAPFPVNILADKDKLKQIFINLVDNACEAVGPGDAITWTVELIEKQIYVRIHNGGSPIPPEVLPKLTKPFYTTKPSGTGLGLAIVKRIVEAHGGELVLESSADRGTTISVKLNVQ